MRALVYTAPGEIVVKDEPAPRPSPGEVLLEVGAVGICGSELEGFATRSPRRVPPLIMGHELAGTVVEVGEGVTRLRPGDRVAVNPLLPCGRCELCRRGAANACRDRVLVGLGRPGAFAEYVAVPESSAFVLPDGVPFSHGAMAEPLANAVHAVRISGTSMPGARVLVMGAGTIGLVCAHLSALAGASRILVVDVDDRRLDVAAESGATDVVNGRNEDVVAAATRATDGHGVDLVLDAVGREETRRNGLAALSPLGTAVWIGSAHDETKLSAYQIILQERRVQGSYAYTDVDYARAFDLIVGGKARVDPWIQQFPLEDGAAVFHDLLSGARPGLIKAQLTPA